MKERAQKPRQWGRWCSVWSLVLMGSTVLCGGAGVQEVKGPSEADRMLNAYFQGETAKLRDRCLADVKTLEDWEAQRPGYRRQLLEMLGLEPWPQKTALNPVVTGTAEQDEFTVEKLHYQSMPGLYVTANLYIPKGLTAPAPAILYVCGHGAVKKNGVSYGNKVSYQHHGAWFARNGYVCLAIDTVQMGEIEGYHHGTYRYKMWWWNSRGYTPAGAEAWNCVRALDYLQTRAEVDPDRIGVTGRSGGGAYSWWIAAIDDRIKVAVSVAGITDLQNHVVDGCVEGHCDCMYLVNTYRWDYPLVAALVAPRPLLISNTDKDEIFPLDGVGRVHEKVRNIYRLYGEAQKLGLHITEGPHKDTQELRVHAFVWFNRFLKGEDPLIGEPAVSFFEPEQLKVFDTLPADQITTTIQETFVPKAAEPAVPESAEDWASLRDGWMAALRERVFRGWPDAEDAGPLDVRRAFCAEAGGIRLTALDFTSQAHVRLRLFVLEPDGLDKPADLTLRVIDANEWQGWLSVMRTGFSSELDAYPQAEPDPAGFGRLCEALLGKGEAAAYFAPRGIGPDAWTGDERTLTQIRRRFMLLGQTLDGMRVWDVRRAIEALGQIDDAQDVSIRLSGRGNMAGMALYASLFKAGVKELDLYDLPGSHRQGPIFLNVLRYLDVPQAVAMAAERSRVVLGGPDAATWGFPRAVAESLGWGPDRVRSAETP